MLLSTSPPAGAFMPMSEATSYNCSDEDGGYGLYGRIKTFPVFPPVAVRPNQSPASSSSTAISVHRRNNGYNLSLTNFHQITNLLDTDNGKLNSSASRAAENLKKAKKKVVFADDLGYALAQVKIMTEPSDMPPKLRSSIVRSLLGDTGEDTARPSSQWTLSFKQPASDYLSFRQKLDERNVALENVLLKNEHCRITGTVKVKNMSFEKSVFVRFTEDKWQTSVDHLCKFSANVTGGGNSADGCAFDTFQFDFDIPCDDEKRQIVEFCVCYRCDKGEFWDSNDGQNFKITGSKYQKEEKNDDNINNRNNNTSSKRPAFIPFQGEVNSPPTTDAFTLNFSNWTQFASWNHLTTDGPYW